jgi:hypothetical protein
MVQRDPRGTRPKTLWCPGDLGLLATATRTEDELTTNGHFAFVTFAFGAIRPRKLWLCFLGHIYPPTHLRKRMMLRTHCAIAKGNYPSAPKLRKFGPLTSTGLQIQ